MGCFSYMCLGCGTSIRSNSFAGEKCTLYLLKEGALLQSMTGQYDSYGRVFIEGTDRDDVSHNLMKHEDWTAMTWGAICSLNHPASGIAAVHILCKKKIQIPPVEISPPDIDQGWGKVRKKYS